MESINIKFKLNNQDNKLYMCIMDNSTTVECDGADKIRVALLNGVTRLEFIDLFKSSINSNTIMSDKYPFEILLTVPLIINGISFNQNDIIRCDLLKCADMRVYKCVEMVYNRQGKFVVADNDTEYKIITESKDNKLSSVKTFDNIDILMDTLDDYKSIDDLLESDFSEKFDAYTVADKTRYIRRD